jgi:Ni2+-binding GTPase involved in maturation of urease and hydrogenase
MTRLHLVNGFLGSGKTTAIVEAARQHIARGERIGVVTNDQGRYLVDTAFVRAEQIPVVQVTGGCFCCAYDQLLDVLAELNGNARPDVIYAESVGSCADLVATVVKPLLARQDLGVTFQSLSVFADSRLLLRRLQGLPLPFSDGVIYIMDHQIDEAGVLVLNKADLLDADGLATLVSLARQRLPERPVLAQNSLAPSSVTGWLDLIESGGATARDLDVDIDYDRYGSGETQLAWVDRELVTTIAGDGRMAVIALVDALLRAFRERQVPMAHVKLFLSSAESSRKVSITALDQTGWQESIPPLSGRIAVLLNARVQADSRLAGAWVDAALAEASARSGHACQTLAGDTLAPQAPRRPDRAT